jgi:VWFA-related protein
MDEKEEEGDWRAEAPGPAETATSTQPMPKARRIVRDITALRVYCPRQRHFLKGRPMPRVLRTCLCLSFAAAMVLDGEARPAAVRPGQKTALVTVAADAGKPVTNLTAKDFIVTEDGAKREVVDARLSDDPLSIVLLIDTTQPPMGVTHPTQDLRRAVTTFVRTVHTESPDAQIALGEFAGASVTMVDFTSNPADLDKGIARLAANPQSIAVLLEALVDAGKKLAARPAPRRAIVTVDFHSPEGSAEKTMKAAVTSIHDSGATLWPITVRGTTAAGDDPNREDVLNKATKANGGMRFSSIGASGLEANLKKVAASLTSQYVVTFARPGDGSVKATTFETVGGLKVLLTPFMR